MSSPQKLLVIIASPPDADALIEKLIERGYPATKVSSTGGFLRRGSSAILSGVDEEDVDPVLAVVRRTCQVRMELITSNALPLLGNVPSDPIEVRTGGAIVFVLPIERFEKI